MKGLYHASLPQGDFEYLHEKLEDIGVVLEQKGYLHDQECIATARCALSFLGRAYLRTEELSTTIDCSTLTSQAHWAGALVVIPFTAEGQRKAGSGTLVSTEALLPGDVAVKYSSLDDTADGFNHVGLFLGHDSRGTGWLIESASRRGVQLTELQEFSAAGGIRRFLPNPMKRFAVQAKVPIPWAARVPKLARFGARQYRSDNSRVPHQATDIYSEPGTRVLAPIAGTIGFGNLEAEFAPTVVVFDTEAKYDCTLGHVVPLEGVHEGMTVKAGQPIGYLVSPPVASTIRYVVGTTPLQTHLHFEAQRSTRQADFDGGNAGDFAEPLYLCKSGRLHLPLEL